MMDDKESASSLSLSASALVPLSERPLVGDDQKTVISPPEASRQDVRGDASGVNESLRQRLFPGNGAATGEEGGVRIAHYEIHQRLGAGGMGAVFCATDTELARDVALKIMHPGPSSDSSLVARFRNEARACARLNHDNIARVFFAGAQDGLYFIAYEFAGGRTLRDLILDRGQLSAAETVNLSIQITLALNHIAAAGIVHRDIKPSNIMVTETGRVKVVDLGLARRESEDSIGEITAAGTTLGTFDYIAPEQARDPRNADVRSDIYSLGCTMYHMLTGQPPYPDGTALQKLLDHQGKSPPDPRVINSSVPIQLSAILRKMMASNPDQRYQAAGLLLNDLIQLASLLGLQTVPAEGIVWKKLRPALPTTPVGAVWVFASVLLICLTAVVLQFPAFSGAGESALADLSVRQEMRAEDYTAASGSPEVPRAAAGTATASVSPQSGTSSSSPAAGVGTVAAADTEQQPLSAASGTGTTTGAAVGSSSPGPSAVAGAPSSPATLATTTGRVQPEAATGPFQLQRADGQMKSYRTLSAAVAEARSGDVILLRYNGYPDDLPAQPPVRLVGTNLIVRAAEGYRPTLQFDVIPDSPAAPAQMFSLRSQSSLTIRDVDLRLNVDTDQLMEGLSLFQLAGVNRILLENVSIECASRQSEPIALFDLTSEAQVQGESVREESEVALQRVICRAQADAFRIACQPRGRIRIQESAFAVSGHLIDLRGDHSMQLARGSLEVIMEHLTCLHEGALVRMADTDQRQPGAVQRLLPRLSIRSEASVFAGAGPNTPLLQFNGTGYVDEIEKLVSWNGVTNLYYGHSLFWLIDSSSLDFSSRRFDFPQWKQLWQSRTDGEDTSAEVLLENAWRNASWKSDDGLLLDLATPAAFELNRQLFFPGLGALPLARDGEIPGVNPQKLPPFPGRRETTPEVEETPQPPQPPLLP
ncbi:MAG: protein kinase domain-containing protein [Planctomycetota bacterium]